MITPEGLSLLGTLATIAHDHEVGTATVALSWMLHQPTVTALLVSATSTDTAGRARARSGRRAGP